MPTPKTLLTWTAPEFRHYPKNAAWYITMCIIAALVIAFFVLQRDIFGAVSIFVIALFLIIFARRTPRQVQVSLTETSIHIDELHIPYKTIHHFWVVNNERHQTLNIETTAYLNHSLIIQLDGADPHEVRDTLVQYVPEHPETEETAAQRFMHLFKF